MQLSGSLGQSVVYTGYWDCIRRMAQTEGLSSFYRGIGVSFLRTAPAAAIQVCSSFARVGLSLVDHSKGPCLFLQTADLLAGPYHACDANHCGIFNLAQNVSTQLFCRGEGVLWCSL